MPLPHEYGQYKEDAKSAYTDIADAGVFLLFYPAPGVAGGEEPVETTWYNPVTELVEVVATSEPATPDTVVGTLLPVIVEEGKPAMADTFDEATRIRTDTRKMTVPAYGLALTLDPGWLVEYQGTTWQIKGVSETAPDGIAILYELTVER